jgi:nocardicin N-oxygenase
VALGDELAWWVADHATAQDVYRDDDTFQRGTADGVPPFLELAPLILTKDGEHHRKLRKLVMRQFQPAQIARFRPQIEALVDTSLDALETAGEPGDLIDSLAWPLALTSIAELLRVPEQDRSHFPIWAGMLLDNGPNQKETKAAAMGEMTAYAAQLMTERADSDDEDDVIAAAVAGAREYGVTPEETALLIATLVVAGGETTAAMLGSTVFKLLTEPSKATGASLYHEVCTQPALIPTAVEELLRYIPNSWNDAGEPRRAAVDTELAGVSIKAGDLVLVGHHTANHDARVFRDPDSIDLARPLTHNPHLAFGHGAHFCLGAHLARLELNVALERLTQRMPALRLAVPTEKITWNRDTLVRCVRELPVAWSGSPERH